MVTRSIVLGVALIAVIARADIGDRASAPRRHISPAIAQAVTTRTVTPFIGARIKRSICAWG